MKITIQKEVFSKFNQDLAVGFIRVKNYDDLTQSQQAAHLFNDICKYTKTAFHKETLKNHDLLSSWAVAQQEFGKQAKHYHTAVEKLMRNVLSNKKPKVKSVLLNTVYYVALQNIIPYGLDDANKIKQDLVFKIATGKEKVGVGKKIKSKALFYKDKEKILGTVLDEWKNSKTKLTKSTNEVLIHFFALPPLKKKDLQRVVKQTADLLKDFCNAQVKTLILDKKKNSGSI